MWGGANDSPSASAPRSGTLIMYLLAGLTQTGMLLAGIGLLIYLLLRRSYRYYGGRFRRSKKDEPYLVHMPRPGHAQRSLSTAPPEVLRWQVEMHEFVRDLKGELDSKMRLLQALVIQARQEADRLEQLLAAVSDSDRPPRAAPQLSDPPCVDGESGAGRLPGSWAAQATMYRLADAGCTSSEIARQTGLPQGEVELILSLRGAKPHGVDSQR